jgi:hypothetical protein
MVEKSDELKKLIGIATDMELTADIRTRAIERIGNIATNEALRALLDLAANDSLIKNERELAIKHARDIIRAGH